MVFSKKYNEKIENNIFRLYCTIEAFQKNEMLGTIKIHQVKRSHY